VICGNAVNSNTITIPYDNLVIAAGQRSNAAGAVKD
jgi:NADH dehydrogenase FAD-containing subunit